MKFVIHCFSIVEERFQILFHLALVKKLLSIKYCFTFQEFYVYVPLCLCCMLQFYVMLLCFYVCCYVLYKKCICFVTLQVMSNSLRLILITSKSTVCGVQSFLIFIKIMIEYIFSFRIYDFSKIFLLHTIPVIVIQQVSHLMEHIFQFYKPHYLFCCYLVLHLPIKITVICFGNFDIGFKFYYLLLDLEVI